MPAITKKSCRIKQCVEYKPSPEKSRFRGIDFGPEPASGILVIEDVIEELLSPLID